MTDTELDQHSCRHFLGLFPDTRPACAKGRDVRAWAMRCNGGDNFGIGLRIPCIRNPDEPVLFDCPELDRRTQAEVDSTRSKMKAHMARFVRAMPEINKMRKKMIANSLSKAKATCPWCGEKDALRLSVAIGVNNHMHARCEACKEGFLE